jgi:hypothetical protein
MFPAGQALPQGFPQGGFLPNQPYPNQPYSNQPYPSNPPPPQYANTSPPEKN